MAARPMFPITTKEDSQNAQELAQQPTVPRETKIATLVKPVAISGPAAATRVVASESDVIQLPPSYAWGAPTKGNWVQTTDDDKVRVGDVMRFTHRLKIPFLEKWQTDYAIEKFQEDGRFQLTYFALNEETRTLVIEARATGSFSPVPLIAAAVVIILAGAFVWVTTISIERLGTVEVGSTKFNLAPLIVFGILGIIGLSLFKGAGILHAARE